MYVCSDCGVSFSRGDNLRRHQRQSCRALNNVGPPAKRCNMGPSTSTSLQTCTSCNISIPASQLNSHRRTLQHRTNACTPFTDGVQIVQSAFRCRIISYRVHSENHHLDYVMFFNEIRNKILRLLEEVLRIHKIVKLNMEVFGRYILQTQETSDIKSFNTPNKILDQSTDLNSIVNEFVDMMITQSMEFQERDSGWALEHILYVEINVNKYSPMGGSSYIKLPKVIENKKAVVNINNQDQCCFAWAITSALYPASQRTTELSSYPH